MKRGKTGQSMGGRIVMSPARRKRRRERLTRQEKAWAARSGPVEVRRVTDGGEPQEPTVV